MLLAILKYFQSTRVPNLNYCLPKQNNNSFDFNCGFEQSYNASHEFMLVKNFTISLSLIISIFIISTITAHAGDLPDPSPFAHPQLLIYKDQTLFVKVPARVGDVVGGVTGTIVGVPIGMVISVLALPSTGIDGAPLTFVYTAGFVGVVGRYVSSAIIGFPFYMIQKIFYDFPIWLFSDEEQTENIETSKLSLKP